LGLIEKNNPPTLTYTVKPGDNLYRIALKFDVDPSVLQAENNIKKPKELKAHQVLIIPGKGAEHITRIVKENTTKNATANRSEIFPADIATWDDVKKLLKPKMVYTITDIDTGLSLKVVHRCGSLHSDAEPETPEHTETLKNIYGGKWSWTRRAVVVEICGNKFPASINGMPHGSCSITDNEFPGVFCVHFAGSRVHASKKIDPDHTQMIIKAYEHLKQTAESNHTPKSEF
jgi:LysM repeat protein